MQHAGCEVSIGPHGHPSIRMRPHSFPAQAPQHLTLMKHADIGMQSSQTSIFCPSLQLSSLSREGLPQPSHSGPRSLDNYAALHR